MAQDTYNVRAIERALQVLNCFAEGKSSFTLVELARQIDLSPSTTLRILATLESQNYVYRAPESLRYYLGFRLAQISHVAFANLDVCRVAHPYLERLAEEFGESTGLYRRKGERRICVDRVEGTRSLRSVVQVGNSASLTRGASGRVLLAGMPAEKIEEILQKDSCVSMQELEQIVAQGYAVSYGQREAGVVSVAAPVFDSTQCIVASVFITGPSPRLDDARVKEIVPKVVAAATEISVAMGYRVDGGGK